MKKHWFKPLGWVYRPTSFMGWIITLAMLFFCFLVFRAVDSHSHSASDTFFGIFPFVVPTFLLWNWLASKTSGYFTNSFLS